MTLWNFSNATAELYNAYVTIETTIPAFTFRHHFPFTARKVSRFTLTRGKTQVFSVTDLNSTYCSSYLCQQFWFIVKVEHFKFYSYYSPSSSFKALHRAILKIIFLCVVIAQKGQSDMHVSKAVKFKSLWIVIKFSASLLQHSGRPRDRHSRKAT